MADTTTEVHYNIAGMDCANCALTLERSLGRLPGVDTVQVNFTAATLQARGSFDPQLLQQHVRSMGYQVVTEQVAVPAQTARQAAPLDGVVGFIRFLLLQRNTRIALLAALLLASAGILSWLGPVWPVAAGLPGVIYLAVVLMAGIPIANKGLRALLVGRQMTIDLLMSIAAAGALLIGESGEAATVILLFTIGEALEGFSAERARRSLRSLVALKPETAVVLRACMDCVEHMGVNGYTGGPCPLCDSHAVTVAVEAVAIGETVLVRPGERIPLDGVIGSGESAVNQASVTGESMPVMKRPGENAFAGTLNGESALEIQVTQPARDSTISRIVRLVEQAQAQRAPVERFIDRFAAWYTPLVVSIAILVALAPPLLFSQPFFDLPNGTHGWLYRALTLLIIACPCALVISTPVTVVSALTGLARSGVLVKGGNFLDRLAGVRVLAFDKTGTLTLGKPVVKQVYTMDCQDDQPGCPACNEMLSLAAAVESRSEHPLAQAVLAEADRRQISHRITPASQVTALAGRGVQGQVNDALVTVSSHNHGHEGFEEHDILHHQIEQAEAAGQTVLLVSKERQVLGFLGVADVLRQTSAQALTELKHIDPRLRAVMLTGDHPGAARRIAGDIPGLDEVRAGLLPGDKLEVVQALQAQYGPVAMIGDGVNDAPALAASSVGIAMGGAGSAQAMETADVVLMQDDLAKLPNLMRASRRSQSIIWQNIIFSLAVKAVFMALALPGLTTLWMAVFADMGASLLVTLNGMRMLNQK